MKKLVSPVRFFDDEMLELLRWVSERYVAPLAAVIGRVVPPRVVSEESDRGAAAWGADDRRPASGSPRPARLVSDGDTLRQALARGSGPFLVRPAPEDEVGVTVEAVRAVVCPVVAARSCWCRRRRRCRRPPSRSRTRSLSGSRSFDRRGQAGALPALARDRWTAASTSSWARGRRSSLRCAIWDSSSCRGRATRRIGRIERRTTTSVMWRFSERAWPEPCASSRPSARPPRHRRWA